MWGVAYMRPGKRTRIRVHYKKFLLLFIQTRRAEEIGFIAKRRNREFVVRFFVEYIFARDFDCLIDKIFLLGDTAAENYYFGIKDIDNACRSHPQNISCF